MGKIRFLIRRFLRIKQDYFWQDKIILVCFWLSLVLNFLFWLLILLHFSSLEKFTPLHYNVYFGVDLIGQRAQLFKIPLLGLIIFLINLILSFKVYKYERIISYFLIFSVLLIQIFLLWAGFLIINL